MLPVPAWWAAAVTQPHRVVTRVDVLYGGDTIASDLAVTAGTVTMNRGSQIRGRIDLTLAEPLLLPNDASDPLAPFGAELVVQRGIRLPDGTEWLVPWGVFGIQTSRADRRTKVTDLSGLDRFQAVADAGLDAELTITAGTNTVAAIQTLLLAALPSLTFRAVETTITTPAIVIPLDADPVAKAIELAQSCGCEVYMAHDGVCEIALEPVADDPVAVISEGAGGVLVDLAVNLDRADAVNQVTVTGNNSTNAAKVQGTATDLNPLSPTAWDGPFGRKPLRVSSTLAASNAGALAEAQARLARSSGVPMQIEFQAVPNPALVCSDAITLVATDLVNAVHVLDEIVMPLAADGGAVRCRTRKVLVGS